MNLSEIGHAIVETAETVKTLSTLTTLKAVEPVEPVETVEPPLYVCIIEETVRISTRSQGHACMYIHMYVQYSNKN
jgi:hypothetical protein